MANTYYVDQLVTITGTFKDVSAVVQDPTAVFCQYREPNGTITTLTYGVDAALKKSSTGVYYVDVDADAVGRWQYRFYSTGTGQAAGEGEMIIESKAFA